MRDNYFVEVKDVDRDAYNTLQTNDLEFNDSISEDNLKVPAAQIVVVEDALVDEAKSKPDNVVASVEEAKSKPDDVVAEQQSTPSSSNSKDIPEFETLKKIQSEDELRLIDEQKDASKFDEVVEDRQYVEVPVIIEEISKEKKEIAEKEAKTDGGEIGTTEATKERKNDKMSDVNKMNLTQAEQRAYFADRKVCARSTFKIR